ncbi:hypothetical protein ZWY2020_028701 [Hordeum vulgare]|nr:hypothetical protein ZWY2020_028701 [Hordeum vulgare]
MLPVGWQCYNTTSPGKVVANSHGETEVNKHGVYRLSNNTHNMLLILGCNTMGNIGNDGLCASVGCCHVDIPPGLTHNYFYFRVYDHTSMMDFSPCDYAFLVDRTNYTFRRSDLLRDTNRTSPVWLDWAIRGDEDSTSLSCAEAAKATTTEYACVSNHSDCVKATNGPGYNCRCSRGYQGNAYLVNGCSNIDECADPAKYPCKGVCRGTEGSYRCTCRPGYLSYDPKTQRCTPKFPLAAQICIGTIGGALVIAFTAFIIIIRKEKQKTKEFYEKNGGLT